MQEELVERGEADPSEAIAPDVQQQEPMKPRKKNKRTAVEEPAADAPLQPSQPEADQQEPHKLVKPRRKRKHADAENHAGTPNPAAGSGEEQIPRAAKRHSQPHSGSTAQQAAPAAQPSGVGTVALELPAKAQPGRAAPVLDTSRAARLQTYAAPSAVPGHKAAPTSSKRRKAKAADAQQQQQQQPGAGAEQLTKAQKKNAWRARKRAESKAAAAARTKK